MTLKEVTKQAKKCKAKISPVKGTENTYFAWSFPYHMNVNFKDYIRTHFEVVKQDKPDHFSIMFKI